CESDLDQLWRYLTRPDDCLGSTPLGPFLVPESFPPPDPSAPQMFIDEAVLRFRLGPSDFDGLNPSSPTPPSFAEGEALHTPLYLFDWSRSSADPWTPAGWQHDGLKRVATAKADA